MSIALNSCPSPMAFETGRCSRNQSNHPGKRVKTSILMPVCGSVAVDDVDQNALLVLDRSRPDDRGDGIDCAAALADDHPDLVIGHADLEDDRAIVLLEGLDADLIGLGH